MSERIYTLTADSEIDVRLKTFQEQLAPNEKIVSTAVVGEKLIITTRTEKPSTESARVSNEVKNASKKLLLD